MTNVYVGLPVLSHLRRFHFDKGRQWNAVEHLVLQALAQKGRTAGQLAKESGLPRRVILEVVIRLMRAGWVELRTNTREVAFYATARGKAVALEDELPVVTERMARRMSFVVDLVTGAIFRRRDLTLIRRQDWSKRTKGRRGIVIQTPHMLPHDLGNISSLVDALFNDDERLVRVDLSTWRPAERLALFVVRDEQVEGLPPRAGESLRNVVLDAARNARSNESPEPQGVVVSPETRDRSATSATYQTNLRQDDFIVGGEAHERYIRGVLRKARRHVIIHSTFVDRNKFEHLLSDIQVAAGRGCRVDILWGQTQLDGGAVRSLGEAEAINQRIGELGLTGLVQICRHSTRSHSKLLVADDGSGNVSAAVGSCNWFYSGFGSFEVSVRLRDPRLVGDVLYETAELARPADGHIPELAARLGQAGRDLHGKQGLSGNAHISILVGDAHDDRILKARDEAKREITVLSHRLGVTAKPAVLIPAATAARMRSVNVKLYYGQWSGPVEQSHAAEAQWSFRDQGVELLAVQRPRIHAKVLLWDNDDGVVSSLNWLSGDTPAGNPRQEIGVAFRARNMAGYLREEFERARLFADS